MVGDTVDGFKIESISSQTSSTMSSTALKREKLIFEGDGWKPR